MKIFVKKRKVLKISGGKETAVKIGYTPDEKKII